MEDKEYSIRLSETIKWLRFPLIFLIIMLHCYSVQRLEGSHDTYFKVLYPFSLWLGETGVPGFFFISGYLFYKEESFNFIRKIKSIIRTIIIPYFIFTSIIALPKMWIHGNEIDITNIIQSICLGQASWFVAALILAEILFSIILYLCK